jgi:hypothetical protein
LPGANYGESTTKLLKGRKPTVDIAARLIFCQPISLLNPAFQLITLAINSGQIIIRDLAPLLLDLPRNSFQLPSILFQSMMVLRIRVIRNA